MNNGKSAVISIVLMKSTMQFVYMRMMLAVRFQINSKYLVNNYETSFTLCVFEDSSYTVPLFRQIGACLVAPIL